MASLMNFINLRDLRDLLFQVFLESIHNNALASTMKQGLINLIPKWGKDARQIDNLRPITLLNCDYKTLAHIFANRLKEGLNQIISESQSGFMKGRSIHNNIRLVLDILDYHEWIEDDGYILFWDFRKAFDTNTISYLILLENTVLLNSYLL